MRHKKGDAECKKLHDCLSMWARTARIIVVYHRIMVNITISRRALESFKKIDRYRRRFCCNTILGETNIDQNLCEECA